MVSSPLNFLPCQLSRAHRRGDSWPALFLKESLPLPSQPLLCLLKKHPSLSAVSDFTRVSPDGQPASRLLWMARAAH